MKIFISNVVLTFAITALCLSGVSIAVVPAPIPAGCKDIANAGFKCNIAAAPGCVGLGNCVADGTVQGDPPCECKSNAAVPPACQCLLK